MNNYENYDFLYETDIDEMIFELLWLIFFL